MLYGWDIPPASTSSLLIITIFGTRPWYLPFNPPSAQLTAALSSPTELPPSPSSPIIDVVGLTPAVTPDFQGKSLSAPDVANPGADTTTYAFQAWPSAQPFPISSLPSPSSPIIDVVGSPTPTITQHDEEISQARPCAQPRAQSTQPISALASLVATPFVGASTSVQDHPPAQSSQPISALASLLAAPTQLSTSTITNARPDTQSLPFPFQRIPEPAVTQPSRDPCAVFQANPILSPARQFSLLNGSFPVVPSSVVDTSSIVHAGQSGRPHFAPSQSISPSCKLLTTAGVAQSSGAATKAWPCEQSPSSSSISSRGSSHVAPVVEDINRKLKGTHDHHNSNTPQKKDAIGRVQDGAIRKQKKTVNRRKKVDVLSHTTVMEETIFDKEPMETTEAPEQSGPSASESDAVFSPASVSSENEGNDHSRVKELSEKEKSIAMMIYALDQNDEIAASHSTPINVMLHEKPATRPPTDEELRDAQLVIALVIFLDSDETNSIDISTLANVLLTKSILVPSAFDITMPDIANRIQEAIDKLFRVFRDV